RVVREARAVGVGVRAARGCGAVGQWRWGGAGWGWPSDGRPGLSLPAVQGERRPGRARVSGSTPSAAHGVYTDVIRERWRKPRHRGEVAGANAVAEDVNPLCGDRVRMMLTVRAAGRVHQAR